MRSLVCSLMAAALMLVGCSKDNPTQSSVEPPAEQGTLLLDRLVVSMVLGGSDSVTVCARKADGSVCDFTVINSDPAVASVTQNDSILQISGLEYGIANVTVTTETGQTCTIPVQVYNQFILDTGELYVTFVDTFTYIWHDAGSGAPNDLGLYHPVVPEGFHALGSLGVPNWNNPNGSYAMMVVKAKEGSDALAEPTGYQFVWYYRVGFMPIYMVSVWRPIAPPGYVALGSVAIQGYDPDNPPPLDYVVCVREDLTIDGESGAYIWHDEDTGMPYDLGLYRVDQPDAGPHDFCYLTAGTFVAWNHWSAPTSDPVLHVLSVELPMLAEAPYQTYLPQLTSYEEPPLYSPPVMAKAMLVPCTIVNDLQYSNNLQWRIANSPFYRLERQVFYKRLYHNHNTSSQPQTNSVTITSGVTTTESETFWEETSISVTVEAGISIECFSGKVSTTVSQSFGYSTQTSVAELTQTEVQTSINMAPGTAAACWQKYNRYVLFRHNGVDLEPVYSWEFGIDSYVVDDYPDE